MKHTLLTFLFGMIVLSLQAQSFDIPLESWSRKKDATLIMTNGDEKVAKITNLKKKKGLVIEVHLKSDDGEKTKIPAEDIAEMFVPASSLEKFGAKLDKANDFKALSGDVNMDKLDADMVYYNLEEMIVKKDKKMVLVQLLNPSFSKDIRVYNDPFAGETASLGVGGFDVAGGDAKSYYVKIEGKTGFRLKKKDYEDMVKDLYGDCDVAKKIDEKNIRWIDFAKHIYVYSTECQVEE